MTASKRHSTHDDKGYSEEKCVRCGWVMGSPPLNCQNDDTPHRFPSQDSVYEQVEAMKSSSYFQQFAERVRALEEQLEAMRDALFAIYEVRLSEDADQSEVYTCHQARMRMRYIAQEAITASNPASRES